jgi:hypothetical protein
VHWQKVGHYSPEPTLGDFRYGFLRFDHEAEELLQFRAFLARARQEGLLERFEWSDQEIGLYGLQHSEIATVRYLGGPQAFAIVATPREPERLNAWKGPDPSRQLVAVNKRYLSVECVSPEFGALYQVNEPTPETLYLSARALDESGAPIFDHVVFSPSANSRIVLERGLGAFTKEDLGRAIIEDRQDDLERMRAIAKPSWTTDLEALFLPTHVDYPERLDQALQEIRQLDAFALPDAFSALESACLSLEKTALRRGWDNRCSARARERLRAIADEIAGRCEARAAQGAEGEAACWSSLAETWRQPFEEVFGDYDQDECLLKTARDSAAFVATLGAWNGQGLEERVHAWRLTCIYHGHGRAAPFVEALYARLIGDLEQAVITSNSGDLAAFDQLLRHFDTVRSTIRDNERLRPPLALAKELERRLEDAVQSALLQECDATAVGFWSLRDELAGTDQPWPASLRADSLLEVLAGPEPDSDDTEGNVRLAMARLLARTVPVLSPEQPLFSRFEALYGWGCYIGNLPAVQACRLRSGSHEDLLAAITLFGREPTTFALRPGQLVDRTTTRVTTDTEPLQWSNPTTEEELRAFERYESDLRAVRRDFDEFRARTERITGTPTVEEAQKYLAEREALKRRYDTLRFFPPAGLQRAAQLNTGQLTREWQTIEGQVLVGYQTTEDRTTRRWGFPLTIAVKDRMRHAGHRPSALDAVDEWLYGPEMLAQCDQFFSENLDGFAQAVVAAEFMANFERLASFTDNEVERRWLRTFGAMLGGDLGGVAPEVLD